MTSSSLGRVATPPPSLLDIDHLRVSAGRAALALALQHAGVGINDEVLAPAYHCESMIAPIDHVGAKPLFYKLQANTAIDIDDLESKISSSTRAVLATHYFGFPQKISELRSICDKHSLVLIEDCAHAFFGTKDGVTLGTFGDYAIGSAMKFFPLFDGGLLVSSKRDLRGIQLHPSPLALEAKGLVNVIEHAMRYRRLSLIGVPLKVAMSLKDLFWRLTKKVGPRELGNNLSPPSSEGGYELDPHWIHARMSRVSGFILRHSRIDRICEGRRKNYSLILAALAESRGIEPLFPDLPDAVIPMVVPMIVQEPLSLFPKLKNAGVPIWRFGEYLYPDIDESVCENSVFLSRHVFQFPCHPELTDEEIQWMVDTVKQHLSD